MSREQNGDFVPTAHGVASTGEAVSMGWSGGGGVDGARRREAQAKKEGRRHARGQRGGQRDVGGICGTVHWGEVDLGERGGPGGR